jgi:OPA family glycerol-3-phosphate transporter-like MFS transporter/OPA family sugar phosphate sensor protein UhpC-like MFS transporter
MSMAETDAVKEPNLLPRFLQPDPPVPALSASPEQIDHLTKRYRASVLFWTTVGYAIFYFVRKNIATAMPSMEHDLGIGHASLGLFLTLHGVLYGISKFANGFVADRANGRKLLAIALLLSAAMNVCFGMSKTAAVMGIFWMLNGWFQGVGFPPIARLLTHWFPPKELATKMSLWNTSHTIGYASILVLTGFLVRYNWRLCFFVPSGIAVVMAIMLLLFLHDTPESVGLPEVEGTGAAHGEDDERFKDLLWEKVFSNPYIWLFSVANFFVYILRYSVADWGPTLLKEYKGLPVSNGAWMTAAFEVAGLFGILAAGSLTDKFFKGKTQWMGIVCMVMAGVAMLAFWKAPAGHIALNTAILMVAGFFIYGPQALIGIAAANLATKRAAATSVGLTGIFGYASTVLSGWGLGLLVQHYGWAAAFQALIGVAAVGAVIFILCWNAPADGYQEEALGRGFEPIMEKRSE